MPWIDLSTSSTVSVNTRKWTNMVSKAKADEVEPGPEEWGYELVGDADKPTTNSLPPTEGSRPFAPASRPAHLHEVTCDPPRCPLSPANVAMLNAHLAHHFDLSSRDMLMRRRLWSAALDYCQRFF